MQTQIRLLLMEQSDQGLLCLLFCLHLLNTIMHCKSNCSNCRTIMVIISGVPIFRIFTVSHLSNLLFSGLGCAFWRFTAIVAVLEYFKKWRMAAIILSGFGRVIGIFIGYAILAEPLRKIRDVRISKPYICQTTIELQWLEH